MRCGFILFWSRVFVPLASLYSLPYSFLFFFLPVLWPSTLHMGGDTQKRILRIFFLGGFGDCLWGFSLERSWRKAQRRAERGCDWKQDYSAQGLIWETELFMLIDIFFWFTLSLRLPCFHPCFMFPFSYNVRVFGIFGYFWEDDRGVWYESLSSIARLYVNEPQLGYWNGWLWDVPIGWWGRELICQDSR